MTKRPRSSVTTILANLVGSSSVSAITQTPASAVLPLVTKPRMLDCAAALPANASARERRMVFMRPLSLRADLEAGAIAEQRARARHVGRKRQAIEHAAYGARRGGRHRDAEPALRLVDRRERGHLHAHGKDDCVRTAHIEALQVLEQQKRIAPAHRAVLLDTEVDEALHHDALC